MTMARSRRSVFGAALSRFGTKRRHGSKPSLSERVRGTVLAVLNTWSSEAPHTEIVLTVLANPGSLIGSALRIRIPALDGIVKRFDNQDCNAVDR